MRRHNLRCLGYAGLYLIGALAIFFIWMMLGWCIWAGLTGEAKWEAVSFKGWCFIVVFALLVFHWGWRKFSKLSDELSWEKHVGEVLPSSRIERKMKVMHAGGVGVMRYLQLGPQWLRQATQSLRSLMSTKEDDVGHLENVRLHIAARKSWEPLENFSHHTEALTKLELLNLVSTREHEGILYVRVSLAGENHTARESVNHVEEA